MHECPKCGQEMEHEEYDPSVGMMNGGWYCTAEGCEEVWVPDDLHDESDFL